VQPNTVAVLLVESSKLGALGWCSDRREDETETARQIGIDRRISA
jgi:hypothetical protein